MNPTAWLSGGGKHLPQGRPEAQGPLPDGQLWSDRQAPPGQSPEAGGPGATPARSAGSRESRPSPRCAGGHDRLNQLRPTPPRSPTPGPPRRPSTHRHSTSRPVGVVARRTRPRHPPAALLSLCESIAGEIIESKGRCYSAISLTSIATRKPKLLLRDDGSILLRAAERHNSAGRFQLPPR